MRFVYNNRDFLAGKERNCWLQTNGLGGFSSTSQVFSVSRNDQGLLVAADSPNHRFNLVHRMTETLLTGKEKMILSSQTFADGTPPEEGWRYLREFIWDLGPSWHYQIGDVTLTRKCAMAYGENTAAVIYTIDNHSQEPCTLRVTPVLQFAPKGEPPQTPVSLEYRDGVVHGEGRVLYVKSSGQLLPIEADSQSLFYADDKKDGRRESGLGACCFASEWTVGPGQCLTASIVFSTEPVHAEGEEILRGCENRQRMLLEQSGFRSEEARELARSADAFVVDRASTKGKTIEAGYPFFGDWGRDTMISLPGCVLSRGEYETARSILRTFLAYERDGLLPNLFPEGESSPEYNSVDAPLLLINGIWLYYQRTEDQDFIREAWPVMERIVRCYQAGTRYSISMDTDGLIRAGSGRDQVTWMDVCVNGVLPTPRHGKPVEINAYWYNALCILSHLAPLTGNDGAEYAALAQRVKVSFEKAFWMPEKGYLKDVISGTEADEQLRCNQIWALTMPFTMLNPEQERQIVDMVGRWLYTPHGLRTLSPEDPEFCPFYGGSQWNRDMAYHQGTIWPFPLGAYYLAWLKTRGNTPEAAAQLRVQLESMKELLREGCAGQLPEIYDGGNPGPSKGCFAQAWSVGELLRVYETLEQLEAQCPDAC